MTMKVTRVRNWRQYKEALVARGSLTLWFDEDVIKKVRQHGYVKHRLWRKLHLAVNSSTQEIEAFELTSLGMQDQKTEMAIWCRAINRMTSLGFGRD